MFALLYQKRNGYDSFFVAHFEAQHEYQLTKTLEVDAVKVISMLKKKKKVVSLDVHTFSALGTLSDLGGLVKFATERFWVSTPFDLLFGS